MNVDFNPWLAFGWSMLAGFVMAMGSGGGGILVGIGHLSILGIMDANMIKVMNQILQFSSRLVSVPMYSRQQRMVWPLALTYGIGAPAGAVLGSRFSKNHLSNLHAYQTVFGALILLVAIRTLYEAFRSSLREDIRFKKAREASNRARVAAKNGITQRPHLAAASWRTISIYFAGEHFSFNPLFAAAGGFVIGFVGAAVGVGGGFLVTPFMASVLLFPMFLVAGTSIVAIMVPLLASIATYLQLQIHVNWALVLVEVPGVMLGAFLGPLINRHMNEKALRAFVGTVLLGIGVYYVI